MLLLLTVHNANVRAATAALYPEEARGNFKEELGFIKDASAKIHVDGKVQLRFCKARTLLSGRRNLTSCTTMTIGAIPILKIVWVRLAQLYL